MTFSTQIDINKAQSLVDALNDGNQTKAAEILDEITNIRENELWQQVSALTSGLHETFEGLNDNSLLMQTKHDIPDATEGLEYVIQTTEKASVKTLESAELALQNLDVLQSFIRSELSEEGYLAIQNEFNTISENLTGIMLEQSFQDLTGQVLNRVIFVIRSIEQSLMNLIAQSSYDYDSIPDKAPSEEEKKLSEMKGLGPNVTQSSKTDVVESQKDVDDLLSDLGI
jgi:chemotaxis protein CheZ